MNKAYQYAIRLLAMRDYSEYKLRTKLNDKEFETNEIDSAIEKLIEQQYLQEHEYIRVKIKSYLEKGYGHSYIINKLKQEELNITVEQIEQIEQKYELYQESTIDYLIQKKLRYKEIPEDFNSKMKLKRKIYSFLCSKGHDQSQISQALSNYF